jgi:hypothetical protein
MEARSPDSWRALTDAGKLSTANARHIEFVATQREGKESSALHDRRAGAEKGRNEACFQKLTTN